MVYTLEKQADDSIFEPTIYTNLLTSPIASRKLFESLLNAER
jgi:hypothetical protein